MNTIEGDLIQLALQGRFDVIVHGCNCQCAMGAGIAKAIRAEFPEAYAADRATTKGDRSKLGKLSIANVRRGQYDITVVNAYTQFHWRGKGVLADYGAIQSCMRQIREQFPGRRVGYPLIGAGLAGGDWEQITRIIDAELEGEDHTLVVLP